MKTRITLILSLCLAAALTISGRLLTPCPAEAAPDDPLDNGLVLYLSFDILDTISGQTIVVDQSGCDNHGTLLGGDFVAGKIGNAFHCMAINRNDGIQVNDSDSLDVDAVTVAAWIRTEQADGQWNRILDKGWRTAYNLCLGGDYQGKTYRHCISFETASQCLSSKTSVNDGQWHLIVGTYDGLTSRLSIDGQLDHERKLKEARPMQYTNDDVRIGQLSVPEPKPHEHAFFDGLIDEVRVYNRVLSADEIQRLYQTGVVD